MLKLFFISVLAMQFVSSLSHAAVGGGDHGPGGDIRPALRLEIVNAIQENTMWNALGNLHRNLEEISDPVLKRVFNKFFDPSLNFDCQNGSYCKESFPIYKMIRNTEFQIKTKGYCYDSQGSEKAASVVYNHTGNLLEMSSADASLHPELKAKLCFSVRKISKTQTEGLDQSVLALYAHELTHLFGFGEMEANRVQDFFYKIGKKVVSGDPVTDLARNQLETLLYETTNMNEAVVQGKTDLQVCVKIGRVLSLTTELNTDVALAYGLGDKSERPKPVSRADLALSQKVRCTAEALLQFCGAGDTTQKRDQDHCVNDLGYKVEPVPEGNRNELSLRLNALTLDTLKLSKAINANPN